jgi:conjugal transfer pilin signal peptidase TrbI
MRAVPYRLAGSLHGLWQEASRRPYVFVAVAAIWGFACTRLFIDATPRVPLLFNWTPSLPCRIAWLWPTPRQLQRGEYIVYSFDGEAKQHYPGLRGQPFFKIVRGLPGDVITVSGRAVAVNGEVVGIAKAHAHDHRALDPIASMVIPPAHYYVQGISPDSFDSRYQASGLVRLDQVVGSVVPLW